MSPYRCAYPWFCARPFQTISRLGGDEEIRTLDPLLAGQVLSQLSYTPVALLLQGYFLQTLKIEQRIPLLTSCLLSLVHLSSLSLSFLTSYCETDVLCFYFFTYVIRTF